MARCDYASRYFRAMSRRGERTRELCISADGGQGIAIGECMGAVDVVDLGGGRQRFGTLRQLNGTNGVLIVHPIKKGILEEWERSWNFMRRSEEAVTPAAGDHPPPRCVLTRYHTSPPAVQRALPARPDRRRACLGAQREHVAERPAALLDPGGPRARLQHARTQGGAGQAPRAVARRARGGRGPDRRGPEAPAPATTLMITRSKSAQPECAARV